MKNIFPFKPNYKPRKPKVTYKVNTNSKSEFIFISEHVYESNKKTWEKPNFEKIPRSTFNGIMNMVDENNKPLKYSHCSSAYAVYSYLLFNMQKTRNSNVPNKNFLPHYENSCYTKLEDIKKSIGIDERNLKKAIDNLILNGYLIRMIGTEKSNNPTYYFYVLLEADKEFTTENSNGWIIKPKNSKCKNLPKAR